DKIYILTSKHKNVSKQIEKNNNVCIVAYDGENWLRINCKLIDDSSNIKVKSKFLEEFDDLEEAGYSLDKFEMQVLYNNYVKYYIISSKQKNDSKKIEKNNYDCIVAYDGENWLRINCKLIDDSSNINVKSKFLEEFDDLEEAGYSLDNPDMQVLYTSDVEATL